MLIKSETGHELECAQQMDPNSGNHTRLQEHQLSPFRAAQKWPCATAWGLYAAYTCLLASFDTQAANMVLGIPQFRKDFGKKFAGEYVLDANWQSALYGGPIASTVCGTFAAGYLADKFGRKPLMIGAIAASFAAISIEFVATTNMIFFSGKFMNSFVSGMILSVAITYIGEVTPMGLRGIVTCLTALALTIGPLSSAIIINKTGTFTTRWAYRALFCSQFVFSGIGFILSLLMPESPTWQLSVQKNDQASRSLRRLGYTGNADLTTRISEIRATLDEAKAESARATYLDCFRRSNLRRTIISVMPLAIQAMGGVLFVASYTTYYIQLVGYSTSDSFRLQIAQQGAAVAGNICSWFVVDRIGRRPLTFWGTFIITAILMIAAGLATQGSSGALKGYIGLTVTYSFFYNISIGATAYTLLCEVATSTLRVKTISIGIALQYAIFCVWALVTPYLFNPDQADLGAKTAFIFGSFGVLSLVYLWLYQPETAGRSYRELDELFINKVSVGKFAKYKTEVESRDDRLEGITSKDKG